MARLRRLLLDRSGFLPILALGMFFNPAVAQEEDETAAEQVEEIVVTGSRIRRDVFSTTTPIQVLDTEEASRIGITSITELMQKSTAVSGQKIDASLNTNAGQTNASEAPPEGGIGSSCVNLRGLGCERTLVLVNGKRLGLAGIRGAPPQPDINILPIGMVEAVDVLTGGLSTVYGADAVAGVVNVRLKRDFEGISMTATTEQTEHEGGEINQVSFVAGVGNDSGNITLGMEYSQQNRVTTGDRRFAQCIRRGAYNKTEDGQVVSACRSDFPDNWATFNPADDLVAAGLMFDDQGRDLTSDGIGLDSQLLIYTPGSSNLIDANGNYYENFSSFYALPNPSNPALEGFPYGGRPFALDRFRYVDSVANDQSDRRVADIWRPFERFSLVMNGYLDPGWGNNTEVYVEGYYFNRQNDVRGANEQIFPTVLGQIPLVYDDDSPVLDDDGAAVFVQNPMNPFPVDVSPIITLSDIPQTFDTELQQARLVLGLTGDITDNWSFDISGSYDRAAGFVSQPILLENNLYFATQTVRMVADDDGNPTDSLICGPQVRSDISGQFSFPDCVPADFMNVSIADNPGVDSGRFATQAEKDYLVRNRTNRTVTELTQFAAYVFGDLFDISGGGTVGTAMGIEYRKDAISSQNSAIGVLGLNAAENPLAEGETFGERDTFDAYAEISAPVIMDRDWADMVTIDAAVRFTDDENFGSETVYKVGALWDINEYLSWNASFNTSFRAPNLREQFLADQAGALPGGADPCNAAPLRLAEPSPALDRLLENCALSGAPIEDGLGDSFTVAIPTSTGGALGLNPETSDSFTTTFSASQPWIERVGFDVALTYFDIEIEDTVRALNPGTIVARCFNDQPNLASPFCDRVERNRPTAPPDQNFISFVRAGFVNTGTETVTGYDLTTRLTADVRGASVIWTTGTTFLSERLTQEFPPTDADPDGSTIVDNVGRIGNPELTFQSTVGVSFGPFDVIWQARWWDDTRYPQGVPNPVVTDTDGLIIGGRFDGQDPEDVFDEFTDFGYFNSSQFVDSLGPLRPVTEAEGQLHHDISATYNAERFSVTAGINNVTDEEPPLIDQASGPNRNNAVTSARYDVIGRSYFLRLSASF